MIFDLKAPAKQVDVAMVVGVTQQAISAMVKEGKLPADGTLGEVLLAYCERLRLQAAGRLGDELGGLDLVQERAALAREQREGQAIKNAVARLKKQHHFSKMEANWLSRIEKNLLAETILEPDTFNTGAFKDHGGFDKIKAAVLSALMRMTP